MEAHSSKKFINIEDECFFNGYNSDSDNEYNSEYDEEDVELLEEVYDTTASPEIQLRAALSISNIVTTERETTTTTSSTSTSTHENNALQGDLPDNAAGMCSTR